MSGLGLVSVHFKRQFTVCQDNDLTHNVIKERDSMFALRKYMLE